jgi:DHA1 family bicyclomycin/chloramphenicol resistance-like MFS transporter
MSNTPSAEPAPQGAPLRFGEFVALVAAMMALGAIGIDSMLPALPAIGVALKVPNPADTPLVITVFLIGFGVAQLMHGPLSDRFGRRPVFICALVVYAIANVICAASGSFAVLLAARLLGGVAIAAARVVAVALIRDCFSGRAMARVSSLAFMVFMAAPIVAPAFGQAVLAFGSWRLIFATVATLAALVLAWFAWRMPETLKPQDRAPLSFAQLGSSWWTTVSERQSLGYTLAILALQGALFGYINSIQRIMAEVFGRADLLAVVFAGSAGMMGVANLFNSRIVMRIGMRRISHTALVVLIAAAGMSILVEHLQLETLLTFAVLQAVTMACFGLASSNFSAMAMDKMGSIAGTASSVQGFVSTTGGALVGALIGRAFDGTTGGLHYGFLIAGLVALVLVAITERGRMFRPV